MDRYARILDGLDVDHGRGLEIGALHNPVVPVDRDVLHVDHASTEDLRAKYADDPAVVDMVDVDVVWTDRGLRRELDEVAGEGATVDYVVASHVVEHVPDLVGWLAELAAVLRPGGSLSLAVPDKRFCFDARRRVTDVSEVVDAHLSGRRRPSLAATFDFWTHYDQVDAAALWAGAAPPPAEPLRDVEALERTRAAADSSDYHDVHAWVFTPASFLGILDRLAGVDLLPPFELGSFAATRPGEIEFFARLVRLDDARPADERRARQAASIARARAALAPEDPPSTDGEVAVPAIAVAAALSERELRLIRAKRAVMERLRRVADRRPAHPR
ncbi:MAG: methyltransferase domain-containing protein [Acidimicrobiia bacterium]